MPVGTTNARGSFHVAGERLVDGAGGRGLSLLPDAARQIGLRVEVDEEDGLICHGERGGQVDGGGGLGDAAFLVGNGDNPAYFCHITKLVSVRSCQILEVFRLQVKSQVFHVERSSELSAGRASAR